MFPKKKRIVDKTLIQTIKGMRCTVCWKKSDDAHHLTTKGAGGDDTPENLLPVCRAHHTEIHQIGLTKFAFKYPAFCHWLAKMSRRDLLDKIMGEIHGGI